MEQQGPPMHRDASVSTSGRQQSKHGTACDACRRRKIKCDGQIPCRQCRSGGKDCQHLSRSTPRERRARVLVSTQYEQKVDRIERELSRLADTLADPARSYTTPNPPGRSDSVEQPHVVERSETLEVDQARGTARTAASTPVEPHSDFTHRLLGRVLRSDADKIALARKEDRFEQLRDMMTPPEATPLAHDEHWEYADRQAPTTSKYRLPPFTTVARLLGSERGKKMSLTSSWMSSMVADDALMGHCVAVYYSDVYTEFQVIIVAAVMLWKFGDHAAATKDPHERLAFEENCSMCRATLETALARLPLDMPSTLETAQALLLGASHAVSVAKPARAWTLTCRATEICQALGYHQLPFRDWRSCSVEQRVKFVTFSMIYMLDKGLSLRLGRCSTLQDHDITTFTASEATLPYNGDSSSEQYIALVIKHANLQGRTYDQLYSAQSLTLRPEVRLARVQDLIESLRKVRDDLRSVREQLHRENVLSIDDSILLMTDEVTLLSLCTLVLRTLRGSQHPAEAVLPFRCIDVAREALECHRQCIEAIDAAGPNNTVTFELYINWALLYTPFAPVIEIFSTVLETGDATDLSRLEIFVTSLRDRCNAHSSLVRLCVIFEPLLQTAQRFVELRATADAQNSTARVDTTQGRWTVQGRIAADSDQMYGTSNQPSGCASGPHIQQHALGSIYDLSQEGNEEFDAWLRDCQQTLHMLQQDDLFLTGTTLM